METMIPTGNSIGAMITLPIVSADKSRRPPNTAVIGNNLACLGPTNFLAMCGAINPKNVMPPPTDTQAPASATDMSNSSLRSFSMCRPTPIAIWSPKPITSRILDLYNVIGIRMNNHGNNAQTKFQFVPQMVPDSQTMVFMKSFGSIFIWKMTKPAMNAALIPIPTNNNLTGVTFPFFHDKR